MIERVAFAAFQGFSTIQGNVKFNFEWDPANPQEIGRNSNAEIKVIGGLPQYNWSVVGTGFGLAQSQSNDVSNILTAGSTACGTATITVTDRRGDTTAGYVRCTAGHWVLKQDKTCLMPGSGTVTETGSNYAHVELVVGYKKQVQRTYRTGGGMGDNKAEAVAAAEINCVNGF